MCLLPAFNELSSTTSSLLRRAGFESGFYFFGCICTANEAICAAFFCRVLFHGCLMVHPFLFLLLSLAIYKWPLLGWYNAKVVLFGMRIIDGIVSRCLYHKTYHTIIGLRSRQLWIKPWEPSFPTNCCGQVIRATYGPDKVGYLWICPLRVSGVSVRCRDRLHSEDCWTY